MQQSDSSSRGADIVWHGGHVTAPDRYALLGQHPLTLWLTGLSASGKSTLAFALERRLVDEGRACYVLDGDNVRHGLNRNLGFSPADRSENIRRIAEVARLMNDAGLIVIAAFISPYRADRELAREIVGPAMFREVHVSTSIELCEARDPKGLYVRARRGEIADFTGVGAPYEVPVAPDLALNSGEMDVPESVGALMRLIPAFPRGNVT